MGRKITAEQEQAVREAYGRSGFIRDAARQAGVSFGAARRVIPAGTPETSPRGEVEGDGIARDMGAKDGTVEFRTRKPIRTEADAIAHAGIDLTTWRVVRCKITAGEVAMKLRAFDGKAKAETPTTVPVWWITLKLERIMPKAERESLDLLFKRLEGTRPHYDATFIAPPSAPHLMVLDLVDLHFGKLAWSPETGQNYDLRIADRVYRHAVEDLLSRSSAFPVDEFLVPLGSDFLHVDNANGSTTAGTPQDVDGRLAKILETAEAAVIWAVEELTGRGKVVVRWIPGNHDRILSYCLARTIAARFHGHPRVTVDVSPSPRKYHQYGSTLIGLTHGDEEKHSSLPAIMATEMPAMWAHALCREWHTGHYHKSKRVDHMGLDTHNGVAVRTLRSLSGVDAWHYRKGYVGNMRSAEAYIYSRAGYVGHFVADVRTSEGAD